MPAERTLLVPAAPPRKLGLLLDVAAVTSLLEVEPESDSELEPELELKFGLYLERKVVEPAGLYRYDPLAVLFLPYRG